MITVEDNKFVKDLNYRFNNEDGFNIKVDTYKGILTIPYYPKNKFRYCIFDNTTSGIRLIDISEIFNVIAYNSKSGGILVQLKVYNKALNSWDKVFKKKGVLNFRKVDNLNGVRDWFVDDVDLGTVLFENTEKRVRLTIIDYEYDVYMRKKILQRE